MGPASVRSGAARSSSGCRIGYVDAALDAAAGTVVRLCGPLVVEVAGRRLERELPSRQGRLVFAYLVLRRPHAIRRDELVEALWPEGAPARADATLTSLLSRLRRALPDGMLEGRGQLTLALGEDAYVDVEAAERAPARARERLAAGDAAQALEIAR